MHQTAPATYCPGISAIDGYRCTPTATQPVFVNTNAPTAPAPPPPPDPAVVAQTARADLPVVVPTPHTSPDETGFQLVALPTWLWFNWNDWHPVSATATDQGVSATVTATPVSVTWTMGDHTTPVVCDGPGVPYTAGIKPLCGHTYIDSGQYTVRATVTWTATWTSNTGATGTQADIQLSTTMPLTVRSAQAVTN